MKFSLDFSIYYAKDRLKAIQNIPLETLTPNELETISKYILCGKDEDGTSPLDRKEIFIKTKFSSYQKNKTVSLDEMMESPTFDESVLAKDKPIYKKVKPTIDKEKAANVPGMTELWAQIEKLQLLLDFQEDKVPPAEGLRKLSERETYLLKHFLIELRTQQYYLMDSAYPTFQASKNKAQYWTSAADFQLNFPILPRGTMAEEFDLSFEMPRLGAAQIHIWTDDEIASLEASKKPFFDFRKQEHLYHLIQAYKDLELQAEKYPESLIHNLLWTLNFYIKKAHLSEQQLFIVECKKMRMPNKEIAAALMREKGIYHQENYISTIWNRCVKLIVDAVELNYDEYLCRDYDKAWKRCNRCNREFLRDSRNFVKKAKALDGLTSRCKECDKELRQGG